LADVYHLAATQPPVAACYFVDSVGIGKRVLAPRQTTQPFGDGLKKDSWSLEPWQGEISGDILDELIYGDMVAAPERYPVEFHYRLSEDR